MKRGILTWMIVLGIIFILSHLFIFYFGLPYYFAYFSFIFIFAIISAAYFLKTGDKFIYKRWWFWTILIFLIGLLSYNWCFLPSPYRGPHFLSCVLFPGVVCNQGFDLFSDGTLILDIRNGIGQDLTIISAEILDENCGSANTPLVIKDGQKTKLIWTGCEVEYKDSVCPARIVKGAFKSDIKIEYSLANETITRVRTGAIVTIVETP